MSEIVPSSPLSSTTQWLTVLLLPYLLAGLVSAGTGFVMLPLGGILGLWVGLFSDAPAFTFLFRAGLVTGALFSLLLAGVGFLNSRTLRGKCLVAAGIYLWCLVGLAGFGPQ